MAAQRLWDRFGGELYRLLAEGDVARLEVEGDLSRSRAEVLVSAWAQFDVGDVIRWLDERQIPARLGSKVISFFGRSAIRALEADPYRLLAFSQSWNIVDNLAVGRMRIDRADPRRLHAATIEALYRRYEAKDTAATADDLLGEVADLLGSQELGRRALRSVYAAGGFVQTGDLFQTRGARIMEAAIAEAVRRRIPECQGVAVPGASGSLAEKLSVEQREAVDMAYGAALSVITGGAGTGKTATLRVLHALIERDGGKVLQMALSARAARRMQEATGRPAMTIAGYFQNVAPDDHADATHLIVDEASMLDVPTSYRLFQRLPEQVRLVLVGDPHQLPPIGPGLVFHILAEHAAIPAVHLTRIFRQSEQSGIPVTSRAIRSGTWPDLPQFDGLGPGASVLPCSPKHIAQIVADIHAALGGNDPTADVQVLCATRADRPWGTFGLNQHLHRKYCSHAQPVFSTEEGRLINTGFCVGDRVICTRNDWDRGLLNGMLGRIVAVEGDEPADGQAACCIADFDDRRVPLFAADLHHLDHAYAITVHKAQGSEFGRVVVPVMPSRILDRTMIYTAATRGIEQVVFVGDLRAATVATAAQPRAFGRRIGLRHLLRQKALP